MVIITIDTVKDSKKDIQRVLDYLSSHLRNSNPHNSQSIKAIRRNEHKHKHDFTLPSRGYQEKPKFDSMTMFETQKANNFYDHQQNNNLSSSFDNQSHSTNSNNFTNTNKFNNNESNSLANSFNTFDNPGHFTNINNLINQNNSTNIDNLTNTNKFNNNESNSFNQSNIDNTSNQLQKKEDFSPMTMFADTSIPNQPQNLPNSGVQKKEDFSPMTIFADSKVTPTQNEAQKIKEYANKPSTSEILNMLSHEAPDDNMEDPMRELPRVEKYR